MSADVEPVSGDDRPQDDASDTSMLDLLLPLVQHWRMLVIVPLLAGAAALGLTYAIAPTFTARTMFLPPQQQQGMAAAALASLGSLSGLAGAAAGIKSPTDQYIALLQSATVTDRLVDAFDLMQVYDEKYRVEARKTLSERVRIGAGKRDGLIVVEVDDKSPQRAADIANRHVEELRRLTSQLALTEAQQRRVFFENQLRQTQAKLTTAQEALQSSGFNPGALKAEPRAAADSYAKLRAEATAAEVRLQTMRGTLADGAPEVRQQQAALTALRAQLAKLEASSDSGNDAGYITRYREYKYQETLFDLFARQYEIARVDEAREGALIQVVDVATPPEKKSKPKRAITAIGTTLAVFALLVLVVMLRHAWRQSTADAATAERLDRLRAAFGRR